MGHCYWAVLSLSAESLFMNIIAWGPQVRTMAVRNGNAISCQYNAGVVSRRDPHWYRGFRSSTYMTGRAI